MVTSSRVRRVLPLAALALVASAHAFRLALLRRHAFNPDEFQHLHGAWCIAKGLLPYRDYFEHHTPWLHFFLAAFLPFYAVETSPAASEAFIFFARGWMWVFSGLAVALTFWLGRLWRGEAVGWTATLLLGTSVMFLDKTLEVRPDVPAVAFLLASWIALLRALRGSDDPRPSRMPFAQSGFLLGAALLCTQKALFTLPGTLALLAWYLLGRPGATPRAARLKHVLWYGAGGVVPVCLVLAVFAANGALPAFVRYNLLVNLHWPVRFSPEPLLRQLFHDNALLAWLGLAGFLGAAIGLFREGALRSGRALLALQAAGLIVGLFLIPVPYAQYLVMLLPLWALFASGVLVRTASAATRLPRPVRLAGLSVLAVVVLGLSLRPVRTIAGMLRPSHTRVEDHLGRLRYILENSSPQDVVMDGFSGLGVFRPHAFFYFFLHDEIRTLLAGRETARLLARLRDGLIAPAWLALDRDLGSLPRDIVDFFEQNYDPAGVWPLWRRKPWSADGQWLDIGEGPTDVLAGRGWYAPEREGARTFRAGRGRRSSVRLPVSRPTSCLRIVLRVRPEYAAAVATVSVHVNGAPVGSMRLSPGWRDYTVELPPALLRAGVNTLELLYHPVPKDVDPLYPGRDALAAVDGLRLECDAVPR